MKSATLLEPIVLVTIETPEDILSDILSDLVIEHARYINEY